MARGPNFFPTLKATVSGVARIKAKLAGVASAFLSVAVARQIENYLLKRTKRRFITKTDPRGVPWAPHKPATVERRARFRKSGKYFPTPFGLAHYGVLVETGRLADSIQIIRKGTRSGAYALASGAGFRIGTDHPAARMHQMGSRARNTPARKFLGFSRYDSTLLERMLLRSAKKAGFR